ncbi:hypothetical protein T06_16918 [Trichinella sp. T6]|nr:hypothetical protein T06_16918 [Trichinella sp. T6]
MAHKQYILAHLAQHSSNHVDKYVITKHYHQLMPLILDSEMQLKATWLSYAWGYASGKIPKISNFLKNSPRLCPQAMPQAIYSTIFDLRGPRLCPQATPQGK